MNLSTERLLVRRFEENDLADALEYLSDSEVMEYIEPAFDRQKAKKFMETCGLGKDPLVYALVQKGDNNVLGHVIFHQFNHPIEFELGWVINKNYWGQGFATEIGKKMIDYGFGVLNLNIIVAQTELSNVRSIRVLENLGMKRNLDYNEILPIWSISAADYSKLS